MPPKQPLLTNDLLRAEFGRLILKLSQILEQSPNCRTNLEVASYIVIAMYMNDQFAIRI